MIINIKQRKDMISHGMIKYIDMTNQMNDNTKMNVLSG